MADLSEYTRELASELLNDIELSRTTVTQQVLKATQLARALGDDEASRWLRFETSGVPGTEEGKAHMSRTARWTDRKEEKGHWGPVADIEAGIDGLKRTLEASQIDSFSGESIVVASRNQLNYQAAIGREIQSYSKIVNRVAAMAHEYAVKTYLELEFSAEQQQLFESARQEVDALLAPRVGDALEKIESIYRRLSEGDAEAISQAMSTVRRLIGSFADAVYPPVADGTAMIGDQELKVGADNILNRINVFVAEQTDSKSRRQRLRQSVSNVYERASAGTHDEVTAAEARYLFISTYVLMGEILVLSQ